MQHVQNTTALIVLQSYPINIHGCQSLSEYGVESSVPLFRVVWNGLLISLALFSSTTCIHLTQKALNIDKCGQNH
jgi:hypothetical protein